MNTSPKYIDERRERSNREARALIESERKAREEKTERLRAMRLGARNQEVRQGEESLMARQARKVFNSSLTRDGWMVTSGGKQLSNHETQKEAEAAAVAAARKAYQEGGLGQAVLHKSNGEIREERTYGKDPERSPG
jgi:hypothetical protein